MDNGLIFAFSLLGFSAVLILVVILLYWNQQKNIRKTQRLLNDRDLLRLIRDEPDGLISPHQLRDKTELNLTEARNRLNALTTARLLRRSVNSKGRHFFAPRGPVEEPPALNLSPAPFLTVEDLLQIFVAYDFRVTPLELIMVTGLPLQVIKREMKYFEKQNIVQELKRHDSSGMTVDRLYVLQEPYRSDPERFREKAETMDLEMEKILVNEKLLV